MARLFIVLVTAAATILATSDGAAAGAAPTASHGAAGSAADELAERRARFTQAGAHAEAALALYGVLDLWDWLGERAPLEKFLTEAAHSDKARPDVRGRAAYLHSLVLDRLGRADEARKERRALGLLTQLWVVGPFDNEGRVGHATAYGPEHDLAGALKPDAHYEGKEQKVSWRRAPVLENQGQVAIDASVRPDSNGTAYVTTYVRAGVRAGTAPKKVALRVGSSGPVKVWINDRLALDHDVVRAIHFDQDVAPAELVGGWNRITAKVSVTDGAWGLFLRLTDPEGRPLEGLECSLEPPPAELSAGPHHEGLLGRSVRAPGKFTGHVADVGKDLESAARRQSGASLTALGLHLFHVTPDETERHRAAEVLARAAQLDPTPAAYQLLARAEVDANDQRRALEKGLALRSVAPVDRAALDLGLGEIYHQMRRERRAEALWLDAIAAAPPTAQAAIAARLKLAELSADRGLSSLAARDLETLAREHPCDKVLRARAELAARRGRGAEEETLYALLLAERADDEEALRELFFRARTRGASKEALAYLDRLAALERASELLEVAYDRSDLYDGIGRSEEAVAALEAVRRVVPDEARLLERLGRLYHRLGRDQEARAALARSIELKPQNPDLKAYLAALSPEAGSASDLAKSHAADVPRLIGAAPPIRGGSEPARVLLDASVTRVHRNGLSETFAQRVVQILDDRGAREQGDFDVRYTPDTQSVEVRVARVYKPNGDVVEATTTGERDLSEPWYGLYYDVRAEVIQFSALEPGDVIDVEYTISDVARRNQLADYFGDVHFFQEELPRVESRYVLIAPKERTLYFNQPRPVGGAAIAKIDRQVEEVGDERVYRFTARDTPKIHAEPGMPGYSELAAYVHVSTYRSWQEVATWYSGLVREQLKPSEGIRQAVREAVAGLADEPAKIRAIYDLVVRRTRYVGLEFGIHGYQPYRVAQVFARKFGDCKDKASLLAVMLRQVGVDASLVLARTRHGGDLDTEPASLAPFDHAIVYLPKYRQFLDGTAEFSGSRELPAQDQDIPVLIVNSGKLERTPVLPPSLNRVTSDWRVTLGSGGDAVVTDRTTIVGEAAHEWRHHYQAPGERHERYEKAWSGKHPGARLGRLEMPGIDDLERPVQIAAEVAVPRFGRLLDGGALLVPALGREPDMLRNYARLSAREHDLVLGYPWQQEERLTIPLQAGYSVKQLPEPRRVESRFGSFELTAVEERGQVVVTGRLEVLRHRIPRAEYVEFRRFCAQVDAAVAEELVLAPAAAAKSSSTVTPPVTTPATKPVTNMEPR